MKQLATYLNFDGNCREAMTFYQSCLGGKLDLISFADMPQAAPPNLPDDVKQRIMHSSLGEGSCRLMASDTMPGMPYKQGSNFAVSIAPENEQEAQKIFAGLSDGANVQVPFADAPWGAKFGMLVDKFGITWMVNLEK